MCESEDSVVLGHGYARCNGVADLLCGRGCPAVWARLCGCGCPVIWAWLCRCGCIGVAVLLCGCSYVDVTAKAWLPGCEDMDIATRALWYLGFRASSQENQPLVSFKLCCMTAAVVTGHPAFEGKEPSPYFFMRKMPSSSYKKELVG